MDPLSEQLMGHILKMDKECGVSFAKKLRWRPVWSFRPLRWIRRGRVEAG